jgi:biopolymer transport protein ExbB/TolQ
MFWVAQVVIVSFIIIFLLHNLYFFFKETLTVPKMKDMVKRPQQKYDAIFRELRMHREESNLGGIVETASVNKNENDNDNTNEAMKTELKRYLMELNAPHPQPHPQSQSSQSNYTELSNH